MYKFKYCRIKWIITKNEITMVEEMVCAEKQHMVHLLAEPSNPANTTIPGTWSLGALILRPSLTFHMRPVTGGLTTPRDLRPGGANP